MTRFYLLARDGAREAVVPSNHGCHWKTAYEECRQIITPGAEKVTYEFIGGAGCLSVQLRVNGEEVGTGGLPLLRLDGKFGGAGGIVGGTT